MLEFLIDNVVVIFGGRVFQQTYGYKMCSSSRWLVLVFVWGRLLKKNEFKLARSFNFTFRYIDEVLSLNNSRFGDFVDRIYPIELEINDTTDTYTCASYLDLHLEIDSDGRLRTKHYDKREDFNFPIVIFPFICSYILAAPAYEVYTSGSAKCSTKPLSKLLSCILSAVKSVLQN
jgi:hypothetical protein